MIRFLKEEDGTLFGHAAAGRPKRGKQIDGENYFPNEMLEQIREVEDADPEIEETEKGGFRWRDKYNNTRFKVDKNKKDKVVEERKKPTPEQKEAYRKKEERKRLLEKYKADEIAMIAAVGTEAEKRELKEYREHLKNELKKEIERD